MVRSTATPWSTLSVRDVVENFNGNIDRGLSEDSIEKRITRYGKNTFKKKRDSGIVTQIIRQLRSPLALILIFAGLGTLALGEFLDAIVIAIALTITVSLGAFQEGRASRAFEILKRTQKKHAKVIRDGKKMLIPAEDVVPGDLVVLERGYEIPADLRLVQAKQLAVNESVLTGEWVAVSKESAALKDSKLPLTQQSNMGWMGTLVASGYGRGIVVATGVRTQLGAIADSLGGIDEHPTPLQLNVRRIARFLIYVITAAVAIIFILGILRGESVGEMLLVSIAIAVAAMPEGLPAAVTIVLALGMESILKRGGLVRNLLAAETLGSTTYILTDKTGTLTQAKMKLASLHTLASPDGGVLTGDNRELLEMAVVASDAFVEAGKDAPQKLTVHGRPLEKAIVLAGLEAGISKEVIAEERPEVDFLKFESARRYGATLVKEGGRFRLFYSGAPEVLLEESKFVFLKGNKQLFTKKTRELFERVLTRHSKEGKRLIAVAYKDVSAGSIQALESEEEPLTAGAVFVGFLAFSDPVREDVKEAIKEAKRAGARVVMVTGDNPETARNIAQEVGITRGEGEFLTGSDIEEMSDEKLLKALKSISVFARVLPNQKLRLVRILRDQGEVVAMTGDGVNDAPALQSANIGIAVGTGTEVAKEASDIVLLNNSFSIIVAAIEEGRKIIDNLRKIVAYLLATSFSEIVVIGGALIAGAPLPFLPTQILWANIIEEGLMSFPFAFEKKENGVMKRDPRAHASRLVLTKKITWLIGIITAITGAFLLLLYFLLLSYDLPIEKIRTLMFIALSADSMFFALSFKNLHSPIWRINIFSNVYLLAALVINSLLLILTVTTPLLQKLLTLVPLTTMEWFLLVGLAVFNLLLIELVKYFIFERKERSATIAA